MKKMTLTAAAVAVTFMAFAFAPAEKNNAMNNEMVLDYDNAVTMGTCDTRYQTSAGFTICDRKYEKETLSINESQTAILDKY